MQALPHGNLVFHLLFLSCNCDRNMLSNYKLFSMKLFTMLLQNQVVEVCFYDYI